MRGGIPAKQLHTKVYIDLVDRSQSYLHVRHGGFVAIERLNSLVDGQAPHRPSFPTVLIHLVKWMSLSFSHWSTDSQPSSRGEIPLFALAIDLVANMPVKLRYTIQFGFTSLLSPGYYHPNTQVNAYLSVPEAEKESCMNRKVSVAIRMTRPTIEACFLQSPK